MKSREIYREVWEKYNHRCYNCGATELLHVHHMVNKADDRTESLVLACSKCHIRELHEGAWENKPDKFYCKRCHWVWAVREEGIPKMCPRCRTTHWDIEKKVFVRAPMRVMFKCKRCDHPWFPKNNTKGIENTFSTICPKCHSYYWNLDDSELKAKGIKIKKRELTQ